MAALRLNLVNSSGGVSYLLPTDLGVSGMASGVGIQIANANDGMIRNFIGWQRCNAAPSYCAAGEAGGWYDARDGARIVNNGGTLGISEYAINFNAYLSRIGNQTVRAGQVYASAQIPGESTMMRLLAGAGALVAATVFSVHAGVTASSSRVIFTRRSGATESDVGKYQRLAGDGADMGGQRRC